MRKDVGVMRERLIELISQADEECKHTKDCKSCSGYGKGSMCMNYHIADHLIANGVIVPPCKVGDVVYVVKPCFSYIAEYEVRGFHFGEFPTLNGHKRNPYLIGYFKTSGMLKHIFIKDIGKSVFLTREEAERALRATDNNVGVKGGAQK